MSWIKRFAAFWYDFFVGEDWRLAIGVILGLVIVGGLARAGHHSEWWLLPLVLVATLAISLRHATRR